MTVSTVELLGGFTGLALFRATFFATARLGIVLAKRFPGFDLATVRLAALSRADTEPLRTLPRGVDFLFPTVARFFRLAMIATLDGHSKDCPHSVLAESRTKQGRRGATL